MELLGVDWDLGHHPFSMKSVVFDTRCRLSSSARLAKTWGAAMSPKDHFQAKRRGRIRTTSKYSNLLKKHYTARREIQRVQVSNKQDDSKLHPSVQTCNIPRFKCTKAFLDSPESSSPPLYVDYVLQKDAPIKQITAFMRIAQ